MEAHSLARTGGGLTIPRSRKLLSALSDERLVEQLRRGSEIAFEVLYDRHHRAILSYCRHMLGSLDEAEDAVQQSFVSAHADLIATDKPIRFKAWLYTIARNRCLTMLRARRERPSDEIELISTAGLGEEVQQRDDLRAMVGDVQELPEDQRAALILSELGDLSHAEVAQVIGCPEAKVKSLVFQARSGLIERRKARDTPCEEIREELATLRGGSLRRGPIRRHLNACPACAEFRADVKRQRQMLALVLPVFPTLGLRESALAAVGIGGTAGGSAVAGSTIGAAALAKVGAAKVAVIAVTAGGVAVGGGVVVEQQLSDSGSKPAAVQTQSAPGAATTGVVAGEGTTKLSTDADAPGRSESAPGKEKSGEAREDDGRGRSEEAHSENRGRGPDGAKDRGFKPEQGSSNGARARDFAAGRGQGKDGRVRNDGSRGGTGRGGTNENRANGQTRNQPERVKPLPEQRPVTPRSTTPPPRRTNTPQQQTEPQQVAPPPEPAPIQLPVVPKGGKGIGKGNGKGNG